MSTSSNDTSRQLEGKTALIIGVGGLGCPAALALARAGVGLLLVDDDIVDVTNLHRQILFEDRDVGTDKLDAAQRALYARGARSGSIEIVRSRFLPENARELVRRVDIVVEGADNFATKFLTADACRLGARPVVHGAGVRWAATAWAVSSGGKPCYRCLFEDVPGGDAAPNCAEAGVMGPVVGFAGALMAELALRVLCDEPDAFGRIFTYDGKTDRLREVEVRPREGCPLCGSHPSILDIQESRYLAPSCAA